MIATRVNSARMSIALEISHRLHGNRFLICNFLVLKLEFSLRSLHSGIPIAPWHPISF